MWQAKLNGEIMSSQDHTDTKDQQQQHKPGNITLDRQVSSYIAYVIMCELYQIY